MYADRILYKYMISAKIRLVKMVQDNYLRGDNDEKT